MNKHSRRYLHLLLVVLALSLSSCRTEIPLTGDVARQTVNRFDASSPARFSARQTLTFTFRAHWWWPPVRLTALGYATIDRTAHDYAVVCLSPLGMKLFEVSCTNGQSKAVIQFPLPGNGDAMGKAIGADIAAIYFDLLPGPDAVATRRGDTLRFREERADRRVDHEFSISNGQLTGKTIRDGSCDTAITFADYRNDGTEMYPRMITLKNHRYGYTLTIQTRSLLP